jgi:hypothetical protein
MKIFLSCLQKFVIFLMLFPALCKAFDVCCDDISFEVRAGVAPTFWFDRQNFTAVSCNATSILQLPSAIIPLFKMPNFHKLFRVPWYIGLHVAFALCDDQEIYAELNYRQSHGRTFAINSLVIPNIDTIRFAMTPQNNYRIVDAYVGARYYWRTCWCEDIQAFFGAKVGFAHHSKVNFTFTTASLVIPPPAPFTSTNLPLFFRNTIPAIGINGGLTYEYNCISFVLTVEMIVCCGPRSNQNIPFDFLTQSIFINPILAPNNFIVGAIGTEIAIPITIGFKYKF